MVLKHQEYSYTFYRVTPNMCIMYKMRNDCLCWLLLVTVDIIRDWLPQVTELPLCVGIELGRCTAPSTVFSQPYDINDHLGSFLWFQESTLIQNESDAREHWWYITCTYFDMARYDVIAYVIWVDKWHHSTFVLKYVSCVIIWNEGVPLETSMVRFKGEPMLWKFALYFY